MNIMTIAIGATGVSLFLVVIWMISLSAKKKREEVAKQAREVAYRKAMIAAKEREHQDRIYKAETGHVPTQLYLAKEAETSSLKEALHWYEKAAIADNEIAMYSMVRLCEKYGDNPMLKLKAKYWQKIIDARGGDKQAQFEAGLCLLKGLGIEQDVDGAIQMIEEVANEEIIDAQLYMGDWCVAESNSNKDPHSAAEWNYRAAQLESVEGMIRLGDHYANGQGVEQNFTRAAYWLELAAETGSARAQYCAGELWARDTSDTGYALAYIWLYLSAHNGYEKAKKRRDEVANLIEIDSIVALQSVAKPILGRLKEGKIRKHTIIKALNKMYKRDSYFPDIDGDEFVMRTPEPVDSEGKSKDFSQMMESPSEPKLP